MNVVCKTNEAFEDTLTSSKAYNLIRMSNSSVLIVNDMGEARWYGANRFVLFPDLDESMSKKAITESC